MVLISSEHFEIIHYYFFSLGILSFVTAIFSSSYATFSLIFLIFYAVHSCISWYVSWFMYNRLKEVRIINTTRYALSHVVLTLAVAGLGVGFLLFFTEYDILLVSFMFVNFFIVFFAGAWLFMAKSGVAGKFFHWRAARRASGTKKVLGWFRKKFKIALVTNEMIRSYRMGSSRRIDRRLADAERYREEGRVEAVAECVKDVEIELCELKMWEIEKKAKKATRPDILKGYHELIEGYRRRILDYESVFRKQFRKQAQPGNI